MSTGHWLDGLWKRLIVAWNGTEMPARDKIEFSGDFILDDREEDGGKTLVSLSEGGGGGGGPLGGDAVGLPSSNTIQQITGDGEGSVNVVAEKLAWDPGTSPGGAEIKISGNAPDAGAVTLRHGGQEVLAAVGDSPRLGNAVSIARLLGGLRFMRRTVNSNIFLDTTTTDMLVHVNAAGERAITLPSPADGRTILFMIAGPSIVTIRRSGSEQINGVAGNYIVPFANAAVIVTCDGTNWLARSYGDATPLALAGDAVGTLDANTLQRITGNLTGQVGMGANSLLWDLAVSSGAAEIKVSGADAGALALRHSGSDVLVAAAAGARLGTVAGSNRLIGGTRLTRRTVSTASIFLDSVTTDTLVHVDASAPRSITLPAPTDGRTFIFMIAGASAVTIKRSSLESINGVAADFLVPFANALVVVTSDGTNWIARAFGDAVTITATAPLTGGGQLNANRTIGIDTSGLAPTTRTISTTAPLTGGGSLAADRTIGIDPAGYVAPTRAINVTPPLTGGGALDADRTIGINPAAYVAPTRTINTTAPLTGGGQLDADRTLAVSGATAAALGVVQLAGNLAGTAAAPLVTGVRADSITVQNADGTHKGVWATAGLRVGDNTAPGEKLDVVGNGRFGSGTCKVVAGGISGSENTAVAIWMGTAAPTVSNYLFYVSTTLSELRINSPGKTGIYFGNFQYGTWNSSGLRLTSSGDNTNPTNRLEVIGTSVLGRPNHTDGNTLLGFLIATTRTVSADLTLDTTQFDLTVFVDATAATRVITLPTPTNGRLIWIKRIAGTNQVTVNRSGAAFIEAASYISTWLVTDPAASGIHPYVALQGDGTNWRVMRHFSIQLKSS